MKKILVALVVLASVTVLAELGRSSFHRSCTDAHIVGSRLVASCKTINGSYRRSSVTLRSILNDDGELVSGNDCGEASFQRTCRDIEVRGQRLIADCKARNGRYYPSSTNIRGVHNHNGRLVLPACGRH